MISTESPRCIIIAPLYDGACPDAAIKRTGDMVICADGGYAAAMRHGITPDLVVGDLDSMEDDLPSGCHVVRLPREKDDTDLVVCLWEGRNRGYRQFVILGATGGRADHYFSNVQCLADCAVRGERAVLLDAWNEITILPPGTYVFPRRESEYFSLLAFTEEVTGVTLAGTKWSLDRATLSHTTPLGVSNEIVQQTATLSFTQGLLMVINARDGR